MGRGKYLTEGIVEGKASVLDNLQEPYLFLLDIRLDRLEAAINIVAVKKGYRVVNQSVDAWNKQVYVLMEKQQK